MRESKACPIFIVAVISAMLVASVLTSCSAKSYSLTKDASLVSGWGDMIQFKVDENWGDGQDSNSSLGTTYCSGSWTSFDSENLRSEGIRITMWNTNDISYKYYDENTYAGWQESMAKRYSEPAEAQADEQTSNSASISTDGDTSDTAYSNCSIKDTGTVKVDGKTFRTFSVTYHYKLSDSEYKVAKALSQDAKQEGDCTDCYGIIKDGNHDIEVYASEPQLLKDVLSTMEFSW